MLRSNAASPTVPNRRGVLYLHVLFTAIIITVIATATMRFHRSQAYELKLGRDYEAAKRYGNAGIDIAMLKMRRYSDWRTRFANGIWATDVALDGGTYSITVTDPIDGDLKNRNYDPVCIEVVGKCGQAIYKSRVNANVKPADGSCLDVAIMSGASISLTSTTVSTDKAIASNASISSSASQINSDAEAGGSATGSTYNGSVKSSVSQRVMPNSTDLFTKYVASSQPISASALPLFTRSEIIANTTFETNSNGWAAFPSGASCQLNRGPAKAITGTKALEVRQRSNANCIAKYSATSADPRLAKFVSGHEYNLTLPVNVKDNASIKILCTLTSSLTALQTFQSPNWFTAYKDTNEPKDYTTTSITFRPIFAGTPTLLEVYVLFANSNTDYNIDDPTLTDITYPDNCRVFERAALTPTLNPYGSVSSVGVYRFDCGGLNVAFGFGRLPYDFWYFSVTHKFRRTNTRLLARHRVH